MEEKAEGKKGEREIEDEREGEGEKRQWQVGGGKLAASSMEVWVGVAGRSLGLSFLSYWSALPLQSSAFVKRSSFCPKDFLLRARVLNLYRQALRTAQRAPVHAKAELRQTIRQEMEKNRNCNDKQRIRFLISEGLERLKGLDEMLDMQESIRWRLWVHVQTPNNHKIEAHGLHIPYPLR
ncbi:hypothetical protein CMV_005571 [Castanea mollissima]|uniref:LYR motif-containing protein 2 n=1 Tax=Castanea mollissima TaxID=60419 RepID=A0A8J4VUE4_9ROSI|nr:hypothetical protein CMV_005571 [Castanea mollissima]